MMRIRLIIVETNKFMVINVMRMTGTAYKTRSSGEGNTMLIRMVTSVEKINAVQSNWRDGTMAIG
jgi:hypothetical protein